MIATALRHEQHLEAPLKTWHSIPLPDISPIPVCASMRCRARSIEITAVQADPHLPHTCQLPILPESVTATRLADLVSAVIVQITITDEHFANELLAGRIVTTTLPLRDPPVRRHPILETLDHYRFARHTPAELLLPFLLPQPDTTHLRPFQREGVSWLLEHKRGILADDMGLGKTIQTICALRFLIYAGDIRSVLVVCPKSLLANWEEELRHWAPELTSLSLTPSKRFKDNAWRLLVGRVHILITNYEQLRDPPRNLISSAVDLLVTDEAHRIRNESSQLVRGIRHVRASRWWALTGTPIERAPRDLITLLSLLDPTRVSSQDQRLPISTLRALARKYVLRRLKADVLTELPPVVESRTILDLLQKQRETYDALLRRSLSEDARTFLSTINRLRVVCDYDPLTLESAKAERIVEILHAIEQQGEKAVVFSFLLKPLDILHSRLDAAKKAERVAVLRGSMNRPDREREITRFQRDPAVTVLLASTRVGGEGLTLTEANHVIFFNEWWNPSTNAQARDRVRRIGQERIVQVYSFTCRSTIEEILQEILASKIELFDQLIDRLAQLSSHAPSQTIDQFASMLKQRLRATE